MTKALEICPAAPPALEVGEVGEVGAQLEEDGKRLIAAGYANSSVETRDLGIRVTRAAALLSQHAAPAPAVVEAREGARELQWPASVAQGCHEAAAEAESGSPLQQLLVAAGDLLERRRPAEEVGATCKIAGFAWPQTIGDWNLMGPSNRLGAWRWYKRIVLINDHPIEEQIKMDSQLQPVWESLIEVDDLGGPSLEEDL